MAYQHKAGDWTCANCGLDKTFASVKICRKCGHTGSVVAVQPAVLAEETKRKQDAEVVKRREHLTAMYMQQKPQQTRQDTDYQQLSLNIAKQLEEEKKKKEPE